MYRQSNDRYSESSQLNSMSGYPPISNLPKMHGHIEGYNPPPMPVYYDAPPPYDFVQPPPPSSGQPYDNRFNWREVSQQKNNMIMNPTIPPINPLNHYDVRQSMHHDPNPPQPKNSIQDNFYSPPPTRIEAPQVNVVQRISGIVKSQLNFLQSVMLYADRKTLQQRSKKERERSRSRSRDRNRAGRQREKHHREWNCIKCSFLNFDFRDRCKRCTQPKPDSLPRPERSSQTGGKNYVPGPDDWRCNKCGNINYARRIQCHRCRTPRNK